MKKLLALLLMIAVAGMVFYGCGGDTKTAEKTETPAKKETPPPTTEKKVEYVANVENGKAVFDKICMACHLTGVAGAAPLTNVQRWNDNRAKGMEVLHQSVINGVPQGQYGVMPPRGTCPDCTDQDLYDAIAWMLQESATLASAADTTATDTTAVVE